MDDSIAAVMELHRAGELDEARAGYEALLAAAPGDANVLGLLGVVAIQQDRPAEAEELLRHTLANPGPAAKIHLRNVNNLFALLTAQCDWEAASALAGENLPDWPDNAAPNPRERATVLSLAEALLDYGNPGRALSLMEGVMPWLADDAAALSIVGRLRVKCNKPKAALADLDNAILLDPGNWQTLAAQSAALNELGDAIAAQRAARRAAQAAPLYLAPSRRGQEATILVLNPTPGVAKKVNGGLHGLHFTKNHISEASLRLHEKFRFASVFTDMAASLDELPKADVVFNNLASGEEMNTPGTLERMTALVERIGRPVINNPRAVSQMTRQRTAELLRGIPGLRVPRIERFARNMTRFAAIAADIAENFAYPVIVRHTSADQSSASLESDNKTAYLVHDATELRHTLEGLTWTQFYVIQYVDLRKPDGNFRKLRAVFLGDEILGSQSGYFNDWMVGAWRLRQSAVDFYAAFPHLFEEANAYVRDPAGVLGPDVMAVLETVRDRVPLDSFGMDFDVDDDGQVVIFEAASTMTFQRLDKTAPPQLAYPPEFNDRIDEAFCRLVDRKIAGHA